MKIFYTFLLCFLISCGNDAFKSAPSQSKQVPTNNEQSSSIVEDVGVFPVDQSVVMNEAGEAEMDDAAFDGVPLGDDAPLKEPLKLEENNTNNTVPL